MNDVDGALGWYPRGHRIALDIARGLHFLHARDVRPRPRPHAAPLLQ